MKNFKKIFTLIFCVCTVLVSTVVSGAAPVETKQIKKEAVKPVQSDSVQNEVSDEKVKASRFLNMLNHNSNYNEAFADVEDIVNNSIINLLDLKDNENDEFIRSDYVLGYIKDMYGIEIEDIKSINADWPQKDGYIYILPRCFNIYSHKFVSLKENEDSTFTVETVASVPDPDMGELKFRCISLFVPNEESAFGYNLIESNIIFSEII